MSCPVASQGYSSHVRQSLCDGLPRRYFVKDHRVLIHVSETNLCYGLDFSLRFLPSVPGFLTPPLPVACVIRSAKASITLLSTRTWQDLI